MRSEVGTHNLPDKIPRKANVATMRKVAYTLPILFCLMLLLPACGSSAPRAQAQSKAPTRVATTRPAPISPTERADTRPAQLTKAPTAQPAPAPAQGSIAQSATARAAANLRAGPGTSFAIVGAAQAGQTLRIIGQNPAGDWLQLADNAWISAQLVDRSPTVSAPAAVPPTAAQAPPAPTGQLLVHFIDVGQGDSELIQTPDGRNILIDAGNPGTGVLAYLKAQGVTRLDLVVFTHPHSDHIGGLPEVIQAIPVTQVAASGQPHTTQDYERLLDAIMAAKAKYTEVKRGDKIQVGNLSLDLLSPPTIRPEGDLNHNSVVLRLVYGQTVFQFEGDADAAAESAMSDELTPVTVLKVGHHASRSASSPAFLKTIRPQIAIYSAGAGNSYGHPHAETIANLKAAGAEIHGTDKEGTIVVTSDGVKVQIVGHEGARSQAPPPVAVPAIATAKPAPMVAPAPTPKPAPAVRGNCDPAYPDVCIPSPPPDLNCKDVPYKRFRVLSPDPHRFDGDHDGIGCE
jgi:competence protein ComEC